MSNTALKVKVLTTYGAIVTFLGTYYAPEVMKALLPIAICVFLSCVICYAPELAHDIKQVLKRKSRVAFQATRFFNTNANQQQLVAVRVENVPHIDYENYLIPTYLRRQEVK